MTQATILMGAFGFLVLVGNSMGCFGPVFPYKNGDIFDLLQQASRRIPTSLEGISYSFKNSIKITSKLLLLFKEFY